MGRPDDHDAHNRAKKKKKKFFFFLLFEIEKQWRLNILHVGYDLFLQNAH